VRRVPRVPALTLAAILLATGCSGSSGGDPVATGVQADAPAQAGGQAKARRTRTGPC